MSIQSVYEKMLKDPKNRTRSTIKQPTPFDGHDKVIPKAKNESVKDDEDSFLKNIDERIAKKGNSNISSGIETASLDKISKLEKRIDEMEQLLTIMMKQQIKLLENIK